MHELGIVVHIIKTLDEIVKTNKIEHISKVCLQIGEVSGIIDYYLIDCFKYYRTNRDYLMNSELVIENIPAITICKSCSRQYKTITYGRICPYCDSHHTVLLQGNECLIKEIEVEEN